MDRVQADVLVGFGGYVATPAYLAARRRGVPIVVHEANPRPGLANRLGARLTDHVFTGHPDTPLARAKYVGHPASPRDRHAGPAVHGRQGALLVRAGGRPAHAAGHRRLPGRAVAQPGGPRRAAPALRRAGVQVLHVIGPKNTLEVEPPPGDPQYVVLQYVDRMDLAYAAADFALCRSGAMTCAELTAVGLPAAYVPLPHGNGEQRLNAKPIVQGGGGLMIDDAELTSEWIIQNLLPILSDPERVVDHVRGGAGPQGRVTPPRCDARGSDGPTQWLAGRGTRPSAWKRVVSAGWVRRNPTRERWPVGRDRPRAV